MSVGLSVDKQYFTHDQHAYDLPTYKFLDP